MSILCELGHCSKEEIVLLWHETQVGNIHKCREKQLEFAEMMWALYEDMQPEIFDKPQYRNSLSTKEELKNIDEHEKRIREENEKCKES